MKIKKGDIVLIPFPFSDLSSQKIRPSIVVSTHQDDCICVFITTKEKDHKNVVKILPSEKNGIKQKSFIKYTKIATLDKKIVIGKIGEMDCDGFKMLQDKICDFIKSD